MLFWSFGLETKVRGQVLLAKKLTSVATNSGAMGRELAKKCTGGRSHGLLVEGRAKMAAIYPPQLCDAI